MSLYGKKKIESLIIYVIFVTSVQQNKINVQRWKVKLKSGCKYSEYCIYTNISHTHFPKFVSPKIGMACKQNILVLMVR
jgi:hypothetical protein